MVWAGAVSDGSKSPLVFIEEGVKVNSLTANLEEGCVAMVVSYIWKSLSSLLHTWLI